MDSNRPATHPTNGKTLAPKPPICDYEGATYRTDFWTQDREYEDAAERIALQALLPAAGRRLIEIGAGYGRLVDLYAGYDEVVLFDYSRSMLREAQEQWGASGPSGRPRYIYVAGDFNALPFVAGLFDTVTTIRVIHHAPDAPRVLRGVSEILGPGGTFVLEYANKRNLKAIARWLARRQMWNPFDPEPYEFVELNFDFHPRWMHAQLDHAGFSITDRRTVSHFRIDLLKRHIATRYLARLDGMIQPTGRWWQLAPSVFVKSHVNQTNPAAKPNTFFRCPACHSKELAGQSDALVCVNCRREWPAHNGLHDFKESR